MAKAWNNAKDGGNQTTATNGTQPVVVTVHHTAHAWTKDEQDNHT